MEIRRKKKGALIHAKRRTDGQLREVKRRFSQLCERSWHQRINIQPVKVNQSRYRPGIAQRVPGS